MPAWQRLSNMTSSYSIPEKKQIRVIINSDANCECDDQYAIVHALLTNKFDVCGIIAEHYGMRDADSMERSFDEINYICELSGFGKVKILKGCPIPLPDENSPLSSAGVEFIIAEALREDPRPLFVACQGALTNVASALLMAPQIAKRMVILFSGGCNYPYGGFDFNTLNDIHAFNAVMQSDAEIWMIPEEVYSSVLVGFEELLDKVFPYGAIGKYLVEHTFEVNKIMSENVPMFPGQSNYDYSCAFPSGESWSLGDSAWIGIAMTKACGKYHYVDAPYVKCDGTYVIHENSRKIRWFHSLNYRFILEDFFAKMKNKVNDER